MIVSGKILWETSAGELAPADGWLRVEGERIVEVGQGPCPHGVDFGGENCYVAPGFIDAHVHLPQFPVIGRGGLKLLDWLEKIVFPTEVEWADASIAAHTGKRAVKEMVSHGTTAFSAYLTVHHEAALAVFEEVAAIGMRARMGQVLQDRKSPAELTRPTDQLLKEARKLLEIYPTDRKLSAILTPRFAVSCTPELLKGCADLMQSHNAYVQTHLSENQDECQEVCSLYGVEHYWDAYAKAGLTGSRCLFAHGVWLSDYEVEQLAKTRSVIVHCPTSNRFLGSGPMNLHRLQQAGVRLAVGTDVAGGYHRSMLREGQEVMGTASYLGNALPTPGALWWQLCRGNALALGWEHSGTLAKGFEADFIVFRPDTIEHGGDLGALLYGWDDRWLKQTVIQGNIQYSAD